MNLLYKEHQLAVPPCQLCHVKERKVTSRGFPSSVRNNAKRSCRGKKSIIVQATATEEPQASSLPPELQKIVTTFSAVPDAKLKYQQLLFLGKKLEPLPASQHTDNNKVRGCVSQVWVVPQVKDSKIYWHADSDSLLTKGLAALLVQGLNGSSPEEIVRIKPEFIEKLGLGQALTPSRNNGFLNMFKLMQAKSLQLLSEQ